MVVHSVLLYALCGANVGSHKNSKLCVRVWRERKGGRDRGRRGREEGRKEGREGVHVWQLSWQLLGLILGDYLASLSLVPRPPPFLPFVHNNTQKWKSL